MAFLRYANARTVAVDISPDMGGWDRIRVASAKRQGGNLIDSASQIFGASFDPAKYLLTHATIVCSVDNYAPSGELAKTGSLIYQGSSINRKFSDFRVTSSTDKYLNGNLDGWTRPVLEKSYRTFIGAQNYLEHVQIPEQSKGRILDAVLRDVGDSLYVDILVATSLEHEDLVRKIRSGEMAAMSMGCSIVGSSCTQCGNWGEDDTHFCHHIKYEKGNRFFDERAEQVRVAELCGHESLDGGGVTFIEASWVKTPAFKGAVLRNVLDIRNLPAPVAKSAEDLLATVPREWDSRQPRKVAFDPFADDEGGDDGGEEESGDDKPADKNPLDDLADEVQTFVMDKVRKQIKDKLDNKQRPVEMAPNQSPALPNDSLIKQGFAALPLGLQTKTAYEIGISSILATTSSVEGRLTRVANLNASFGVNIPEYLYRVATLVGPYRDPSSFVKSCHASLGRNPTRNELLVLARLAKMVHPKSE